MNVAEAKIALPLPALLRRLGVQTPDKDRFKIPCPLHAEQKGQSFSVEHKNGAWLWNCFGKCGCGGDEVTFLEKRENLSKQDATKRFIEMAGGSNGAPAPRRERVRLKPKPAAAGSQSCLRPLSEKDLRRIADWRGYSEEFMRWLHDRKLIGRYGKHVAFPVTDNGQIIGGHARLGNGWCYTPGAKTRLFIIGDLSSGNSVHIFESQWDAFAFLNALSPAGRESVVVVITRGAANGGLVAGVIPEGATVFLWPQNDLAAQDWTEVVCKNISDCVVKIAQTPERCGDRKCKDLNDWIRAGGTAEDLLGAITDAEVLCAPVLIQDAATLLAQPIVLPPDIIEGIVHRGGKMILGGASKTFKTWTLIDLAVSVATGAVWFNGYPTKKGAALFVNFELPEPFFWNRARIVCDERQLTVEPGMLHVWNLRGHVLNWAKLQQQISPDTYALIILDPIYKLLLGRDENRAGDIASLLNELEVLAVCSGAAVAFGAHYSKGNQAQKESIDRIGGSGVFGRDPDTILNFTRHEEQDCFTVEMTLRNHPPQNPFVVRWEYPLFIVDSLLDPNRLKQAGGRPRLATQAQVLDLLDEKPLKAVEWQKRAREEFGIASSTFYDMKRDLQERGGIQSIAGAFRKI